MGMAILTRSVKALVALIDHNPKQYWSIYQSPCTRVSWLGKGAPILTRLIKSIYLINHNPLPFHLSTRIRIPSQLNFKPRSNVEYIFKTFFIIKYKFLSRWTLDQLLKNLSP